MWVWNKLLITLASPKHVFVYFARHHIEVRFRSWLCDLSRVSDRWGYFWYIWSHGDSCGATHGTTLGRWQNLLIHSDIHVFSDLQNWALWWFTKYVYFIGVAASSSSRLCCYIKAASGSSGWSSSEFENRITSVILGKAGPNPGP